MNITWLTQGGFLFEREGFRLVVDPYMSDILAGKATRLAPFPLPLEELRPDVVLCTHDHLDHLDPETVAMIAGAYPDCAFTGPERAFAHLGRLAVPCLERLEIGKAVNIGPFKITPVFARHSDPSSVGLAIESEGRKIYLTADTEYDDRLFSPLTEDSHLLLICINGRLGNMTWRQAVDAGVRLKPKAVTPMHYGLFAENTEDPKPFLLACRDAGLASFAMEPGKEFPL